MQTKTALAPKPANFFPMVLIFLFRRDKVENFKKMVLGGSRTTEEISL